MVTQSFKERVAARSVVTGLVMVAMALTCEASSYLLNGTIPEHPILQGVITVVVVFVVTFAFKVRRLYREDAEMYFTLHGEHPPIRL
jgi:hypothetical protein